MNYVHKRLVSWSTVTPRNRSPYVRENLNQVKCSKPMYAIRTDNDFITPYDENVTCPECLTILGGRRHRNEDVMRDVNRLNILRKDFQARAEERRYQ